MRVNVSVSPSRTVNTPGVSSSELESSTAVTVPAEAGSIANSIPPVAADAVVEAKSLM